MFVKIAIAPKSTNSNFENRNINCLIDTGAERSFIDIKIIEKLKIEYIPMNIDIHSATGTVENAIKGRVHLNFYLCSNKGELIKTCLVFFISALESFEAIIGADLLFHTKELISLNAQGLKFRIKDKTHNVRIEKAKDVLKLTH